jgi:hypothetical protein
MQAQHGVRAGQQPQPARHIAWQPVQQRRQQRPITGVQAHLLLAQLALQDGDRIAQRQDLNVLSRSLIGSVRSTANALVTPK